MMIVLDTDNPRSVKGLQLAADAGQWARCRTTDGRKAYGVPSQHDPNRRYLVTCQSCDCADFQRRQQPCKHMLGVRLHVGLTRIVQPTPTKLERRWTCGMDGCPFTTTSVDTMTDHVQTSHGAAVRPATDAIFDQFRGE